MKYIFYLSFIVVFALHTKASAQNAGEHLSKAQTYLKEKSYSQAILELDEAIRKDVKSAKAYFLKGLAEYQLDNPSAALYNFDIAIVYEPQYLEAYYNRGLIQAGMQSHELAIQDFSKILEINPQITPVYFQRGVSLLTLQKYDDAKKDFLKVSQLDPQEKKAHYQLAWLAQNKENRQEDALAHLQKALNIDPKYEDALKLRASIYLEKQMPQKLKIDATALIQLNPYHWDAYLMRAEAKLMLKEYEEARQDLQKILQKQSENAAAYFCLGKVEKAEGKNKAACIQWEKAAKLGHPQAKEMTEKECN